MIGIDPWSFSDCSLLAYHFTCNGCIESYVCPCLYSSHRFKTVFLYAHLLSDLGTCSRCAFSLALFVSEIVDLLGCHWLFLPLRIDFLCFYRFGGFRRFSDNVQSVPYILYSGLRRLEIFELYGSFSFSAS